MKTGEGEGGEGREKGEEGKGRVREREKEGYHLNAEGNPVKRLREEREQI